MLDGSAIDAAVADLRYGAIGVTLWHAMSYALASTTWGAFPAHPITDIQSRSGSVGKRLPLRSSSKVRRPRSIRGEARTGVVRDE